jgi:AAA+ superfamily predicted ATPase
LFLTTNRIDHLDEAFASRIYIQIPYLSPGQRERALIWRQLSQKLDHALSDEDFEHLSERELSGRQVKNILSAASLYASGSEPRKKLQVPDIEAVLPYVIGKITSDDSPKLAEGSA